MAALKSATAVAAIAAALVGCARVNVPEDAFFVSNARVAAEHITLPSNPPPSGSEDLTLAYPQGMLAATRVRGAPAGRPLFLSCGGNMFRRSSAGGAAAERFRPFGDVLMFDYPGYGDSSGEADMAHFRAAESALVAAARAQADAEGRPLILWGHSLGGVVCSQMAKAARADVLVIEASTPSARAAVDDMVGLWRPLVKINLAPGLAEIDVPASLEGYGGKVVVLEAGRDEELPPSLSRRLERELRGRGVSVERLAFPRAGHNDISAQPDFEPRIRTALGL